MENDNQYQDDFKEGQLVFLGKPLPDTSGREKKRRRAVMAAVIAAVILIVMVTLIGIMVSKGNGTAPGAVPAPSDSLYRESSNPDGVWEQDEKEPEYLQILPAWFEGLDTVSATYCATLDTTVNDIPLCFYMPLNSTPDLCLGTSYIGDNSSVLIMQAADIRADNKKIVGAFVLKGKPLAWGLSKKGYCAIIDGVAEIGMADNSPLFEKATETGGYFFRQYALVHNGRIVEQELKTRSLRRGLCQAHGHTFVAETREKTSMHDFSEALTALGVEEAIYLIGGDSRIAWRNNDGSQHDNGAKSPHKFQNINFIRWR